MKRNIPVLLIAFLLSNFSFAQQNVFDHSEFNDLLKANVDESGMVNYTAFMNNETFNDYLSKIAKADLSKMSNEEKLAFYINAYNASVIKNVIDNYPIDSPMDVDGFFKEKEFTIAGRTVTLDELEHNYTLKIEPALSHFGLVCAAKSCPKLLQKAYTGKDVIALLEENAKTFLNDKHKNYLDRENKVLYLSRIFDWFKKYFEGEYGSVMNTVKKFINGSDRKFLQNNDVEIEFLEYNWKLNSQ